MSESKAVRKWGDDQQYEAAPMQGTTEERGVIIPQVKVLWMTPDPLGSIAAMCRMYEGKVTYDLSDITNDERRHYFAQVQKTHLQAPLEAVKIHFFIEGVTRSFTHQLVRQRTAVYAQESLRFAVKENIINEVSIPPSIVGTQPLERPFSPGQDFLPSKKEERWRAIWDDVVMRIEDGYTALVNDGMPAEDARGLLPHAITTRANYVTDLRNLIGHAGNRLCTQAQFEWRTVFLGIMNAIANYKPDLKYLSNIITDEFDYDQEYYTAEWEDEYDWQFTTLAHSDLFRPVCYQLGRCPFQASFDRECTIRKRVEIRSKRGVPSNEWNNSLDYTADNGYASRSRGIDPREWMADPAAARRTGGGGHE